MRPRPGVVFKPFPARHGVWALGHNSSPPPRPRRHRGSVPRYLATSPAFSPCALQVEGGSEFAAEFEPAGRQRGLHRFVLPPRSPQLNRAVERAHRTHTQEFYPLTPGSREIRQLRPWENPYNTLRPHPALGDLPPQQFLRQLSSQRKE